MFCKECGAEIPNDIKHCPECGAKLVDDSPIIQQSGNIKEESFFQKNKKVLIGCCVGLLVIFFLVAILGSGSDSHSYDTSGDEGLSEAEFKEQCESVDFNTLNKNPDKYTGDKLKVSGKIIQIMEDNNGGKMRLATGDYSSDVVYVVYKGTNNFVEDDYVTVYGYCDGSYTYTSTIGASVTLPKIDAMYIDST